ncbi:MAG: hypothetical protein ACXV2D_03900 [Halobacteriota archaeon]
MARPWHATATVGVLPLSAPDAFAYAAFAGFSDYVGVFVIGADYKLYQLRSVGGAAFEWDNSPPGHNVKTNAAVIDTQQPIDPATNTPVNLESSPGAYAAAGRWGGAPRIDVFVQGGDGVLYQKWWTQSKQTVFHDIIRWQHCVKFDGGLAGNGHVFPDTSSFRRSWLATDQKGTYLLAPTISALNTKSIGVT